MATRGFQLARRLESDADPVEERRNAPVLVPKDADGALERGIEMESIRQVGTKTGSKVDLPGEANTAVDESIVGGTIFIFRTGHSVQRDRGSSCHLSGPSSYRS
jgi:hypothetical protein